MSVDADHCPIPRFHGQRPVKAAAGGAAAVTGGMIGAACPLTARRSRFSPRAARATTPRSSPALTSK